MDFHMCAYQVGVHQSICKYPKTIAIFLPIKSCTFFWDVNHRLDFSSVVSVPLPAWRNLFSTSRIFCRGSFQPSCTGIAWPAEGTSQPLTISKKWKNPSSAWRRKRSWVQALFPIEKVWWRHWHSQLLWASLLIYLHNIPPLGWTSTKVGTNHGLKAPKFKQIS